MINIELEYEIIQYVKKMKNGIKWNKLPLKYNDYLLQRYSDNVTNTPKESYLRIIHNIEIIPICPICGNIVKYNGNLKYPYDICCSNISCKAKIRNKKSKETKLKRYGDENFVNPLKTKQTKLERYGDENFVNPLKTKQTKLEKYGDETYTNREKNKQTCLERYGVINGGCSLEALDKIKQTCIKKYGVEYSWLIPGVNDKSRQTKIERYGNETYTNRNKAKQTCLEKYGVENVFQVKEFQEKYKQTCLEHYGVDHNWKIPSEHKLTHTIEAEEKRKATSLKKYGFEFPSQSQLIKDKVNKTKKKNHTFNVSNTEDESYILIKEKYPDIVRQYKSIKYPFTCDFYIPSIDTYIECNYHWTHGNRPYNKEDEYCINLINIWKEKNTKYYNNAIITFTTRDVDKRNKAKENNLNWFEFFNINDLKRWLFSK